MRKYRFVLAIASLWIATGCSGSKEGPLSRDQAINIAAHHLIGKNFDVVPPATVSFNEGKYTVSFMRQVPGGTPGETYYSRVVFDAKSSEALEVEVASGPVSAANEPDTQPSRTTPLNEEVDSVEALRKQLTK